MIPWRRWKAELGSCLYPRRCWVCPSLGFEGGACLEHRLVVGFPESRCRRCAGALGKGIKDGSLCPDCRRKSPPFGRVLALAPYRGEGSLATWIMALKYGGRPDLAQPLGTLLAGLVPSDLNAGLLGAVVVPVPLHRQRRLERGYDQARLLARVVAQETGLESLPALVRKRWTAPQGSSLGSSRTANVQGAFQLRRSSRSELRLRTVLLVDDVFTSGATLAACSRVLLDGGASSVHGLVLARAGAEDRGEDAGGGGGNDKTPVESTAGLEAPRP